MLARRGRVLVVDRREETAAGIVAVLSEVRCLATVVVSLDGAIRAAKELRPDLALVHVAPGGRHGSLVAMALGDELPALRVVAYGCKLDRRWLEAAGDLGLDCPVLDEERVHDWIRCSAPAMAKLARLERVVRIRTRRFGLGAPVGSRSELPTPVSLNAAVADLEETAIRAALGRAVGNKREAARLLSISESSLRTKMRKYGIDG